MVDRTGVLRNDVETEQLGAVASELRRSARTHVGFLERPLQLPEPT